MSITNFLATEFNGEQVIGYFNVPPDDHAVRAAMHYTFRMHKDELPHNTSLSERCKLAASLTIQAVEYRYTLFKEMIDDFFQGSETERDALAIAVICNEYTPHINEPCQDKDGNLKTQFDGIDEDLGERANILWEEAVNLQSRGSLPYEVSPESIFLAHVQVFEDFAKYEADEDAGEEFEDGAIDSIINKDIPAIRCFIRPETEIGAELNNFLNHMVSMHSPSVPSENKPRLSLVPKPPEV